VHGGPESQRRPDFLPTTQGLVAAGIAVLSTNVRGSTGYGKTYCHLDDVERRMDSVADLQAAVTWLREQPAVIGDRIAVMGQSYGGFMVLAALTTYPEIWAAGVEVVGIANFVSFLEQTGPWRRKTRAAEYGDLERDAALLREISPLHKADRITAPLFIIHGRNDPRVPLGETEQIATKLRELGREVELMIFDDEGHGMVKRPNRQAGFGRAVEFLVQYLIG
jgi:dipeptidyl aminopeptidase/acylaminoacyl peptidase